MNQTKLLLSSWQQALSLSTWRWFFLLLVFTIWNYRLGLLDLPSRDQLMFLDEKVFFPNNWDFFLHSMEFSRGRLLFAGDYFLFRPGHFTLLGLNQILTEGYLQFSGLFTYPLVAFTALTLFLVGRQLVSPLLAFTAALLWIDLFPGAFTIVWRHINPYLLACAFLGMTLALLVKAQRQQEPWPFSAAFYLFLASLFHEMVLFSIVTLFLLLSFSFRSSTPTPPSTLLRARELHKRILSPALVGNLFLNLLDLLLHPLPALFGMDDTLHTGDVLETLLTVVIGLPGAAASSLGLPFLIEKFTLGNWPFMDANRSLVLAVGLPLILLLAYALLLSFYRLTRGDVSPKNIIMSLSMPFFWGIVLIWGSGRAFSRGVNYLFESPHYYLLLDWLLLLTLLAFLSWPWLQRLVLLAMLFILPMHNSRLQELLAEQYPRAKARADAYHAFTNALTPLSSTYCLVGKGYSPDSRAQLLTHSDSGDITLLLRPFFCRQGDSRTASQLLFQDNHWWLAKVVQASLPVGWQWQGISLPTTTTDRWHTDGQGNISDPPRLGKSRVGSFLTGDGQFTAVSLAVTMSLPYRGGVVFGVQDLDNYDLLRIHEHRLVVFRYRMGKAVRAESFENHLPPSALSQVRLEMFYQGETLWLVVNGDFFTTIADFPAATGKVGLFSPAGGLGKQVYTNFQTGSALPQGFIPLVYEPVASLWKTENNEFVQIP